MKRLLITGLALPVLLSAGGALASEEATAVSYTDQTNVIERFRYLERIDVTAEKPMVSAQAQEPLSADLQAILDEAESVEDTVR
jgi:hypothetical protein